MRQLGSEVGADLDKRRFRTNIYADFESGDAFSEVVERDPRCKMITLDPDTVRPIPRS